MNYDTVLFDLDGTLIDTKDLIYHSFKETIKKLLEIEVSEEEFLTLYGEPILKSMGRFHKDRAQELVDYYIAHNHDLHDVLIKGFPQIIVILEELRKMGIKMAVVTSKRRETTLRGLRLFDIEKYFELIISSDDVKAHKPDPEPLNIAIERLKSSKEKVLMVGDTPFDIEAAKRAGVKSVLVGWTHLPKHIFTDYPADYIIHNPMDLIRIL